MDVILEADKSGGIEFGTALPVPRTKKPRHREVTTFGIGLLYPRNPRPYIYNTLASPLLSLLALFTAASKRPTNHALHRESFSFRGRKPPSSPPLLVRRRGLESSTGVETKLLRSWYGIIHTVEISRHVSVSRISSPLYVCIYIYVHTSFTLLKTSQTVHDDLSPWKYGMMEWIPGAKSADLVGHGGPRGVNDSLSMGFR